MNYKVLWIDDDYQKQMDFIGEAEQESIDIFPCASHEEGMVHLNSKPDFFHAVILDAKVKKSKEDTVTGLSGLTASRDRLIEINKDGYLPYFIFTGQPDYVEAEWFKQAFGKYYIKASDNDLLFEDLKKAIKKKVEYQIQKKYSRIFELCTDKYIGCAASKDLLSILKNESAVNAFADPELYFNPLRKIVEDLFKSCNKWGILPDIFLKGSVALNESSRFLSGSTEKGYQLNYPAFPKVVSDNMRNILAVCQPASHRLDIDTFVSQVSSPYLLFSITYQLLDVLLWFKLYTDENKDIETNKANCKAVETPTELGGYTGKIEQDGFKNYCCGNIVLTYRHMNENAYKVGDTIRIIKTNNNTNEKTMHLYSKSVMISERI